MLMEVLLPVLVMLVMLLLQSVLLLALLWLSTAITRLFSVGSAPMFTKWHVRFLIFLEAYNVSSVLLGFPIFSVAQQFVGKSRLNMTGASRWKIKHFALLLRIYNIWQGHYVVLHL